MGYLLQSDLANLDHQNIGSQNVSVKKKKNVLVFSYFRPAETFQVFGARESFGYLGLSTARDLFISGGFDIYLRVWGTSTRALRYRVEGKKRVVDITQTDHTQVTQMLDSNDLGMTRLSDIHDPFLVFDSMP